MTTSSEAARQLAALRQRATFVCDYCGREFEALARKSQQARTCSQSCRQRLYLQHKRERQAGYSR